MAKYTKPDYSEQWASAGNVWSGYIGNNTIPPDVTDITVGVVLSPSTYYTLGGRVDNLKIVKFTPV